MTSPPDNKVNNSGFTYTYRKATSSSPPASPVASKAPPIATLDLASTIKSASGSETTSVAVTTSNTNLNTNTNTHTHTNTNLSMQDLPSSPPDLHHRANSSSIRNSIPITKSQKKILMKQARKDSKLQTSEQRRTLSIIKIVTKFTVLVTVDAIFAVIGVIISAFLSTTTAVSIHAIVASMCAIYCFKVYEKEYSKRCKLCHWCAFKLCICYLFKTIRTDSVADIHKALDKNEESMTTELTLDATATDNGENIDGNININVNSNIDINNINMKQSELKHLPSTESPVGGSELVRVANGVNFGSDETGFPDIDTNNKDLDVGDNYSYNYNYKYQKQVKVPEPKIDASEAEILAIEVTGSKIAIDRNVSDDIIQRFITLEEAFYGESDNDDFGSDEDENDNDAKRNGGGVTDDDKNGGVDVIAKKESLLGSVVEAIFKKPAPKQQQSASTFL